MKFNIRSTVFALLALLFQVLFFVLFITLTKYGEYGFPAYVTLNEMSNISDSTSETVTTTGTESTDVSSSSSDGQTDTISPTTLPTSQGTIGPQMGVLPRFLEHQKKKKERLVIVTSMNFPDVPVDPITGPYYSMLPINVMIFVGLGLLFSSIKCTSFNGLGLVFFLACFSFQWAALVVPWLMQAAAKIPSPEKINYNITTLIDILYAVFSMIVAYGALVGRTSRIQLLIINIFGVVLYATNRMVLIYYLVVLDLAGSMSVFAFGAFYGLAISWSINAFYKSSKCNKQVKCELYSGYFENLLALLGTVFIFVNWPYFCAYLIPISTEMYLRAILNTYFAIVAGVVVVYALSSAVTKCQKIDILHIQRATLAAGVAVASVAPLILHIWGAVLLGALAGGISVIFMKGLQPLFRKLYKFDTCAILSTFAIPGIIGGIASAVMANMAVSPLDYTADELAFLYPAIVGTFGVGSPRSDTTQGGYQMAGLVVSIAMGIVGGLLVGILVRYMGPLCEDEYYSDNTDFSLPYECGSPCNTKAKCPQACQDTQC